MTTFTGPIRRRNHGKGHSYRDAHGHKVPGVTTVISGGYPKPALVNWAANATADYAVDHWDELSQLPPSKRLDRLRKAKNLDRDAAAKRGTEVHRLAEKLVLGEEVEVPDEISGHVEAYVQFLDDWDVRPVVVEGVVVSHRYGYAGTLDLIADLRDPDDPERTVRWLLDVKTSRSGVFGEVALQLAGYRFADAVLAADGTEQPVPAVEATGVIHVRADGYDLVPVTAGPAEHRSLLYVQQIAQFAESSSELVGEALTPPRLLAPAAPDEIIEETL